MLKVSVRIDIYFYVIIYSSIIHNNQELKSKVKYIIPLREQYYKLRIEKGKGERTRKSVRKENRKQICDNFSQ